MDDITGVAGLIIWTEPERHAAMADFYRDVVGLKPRSDRDGFINFEFGAMRLTVARHDGVNGSSKDPLRMMVNLDVGDIHGVHRRLVDAGVAFTRLPEQEPWGGWIATFNDPDGNTVQLMQTNV